MNNKNILSEITYLVGDENTILSMPEVLALKPFSEKVINFLADVSNGIMSDNKNRIYSDVVSFAFWIRTASVNLMKKKYSSETFRLGRGVAFHIAPSNVPVNFAYSLVAGLLTGNANIVRVPTKEFVQVDIIANAFRKSLEKHSEMQSYIALIQYGHNKKINDVLSSISDTRIVWGGDSTIAEIRESNLPPRSTEILFADRYSMAVIDSDSYMKIENKDLVAEGFYNDTFLMDQNACTSPKVVLWHGSTISEAKKVFWEYLHKLVKNKYDFQDIYAINNLSSRYLAAITINGIKIVEHEDNLITRLQIGEIDEKLLGLMGNCGFFFEYDCNNPMELWDICNNKRCQTIGVIGDKNWIMPLIEKGVKGIDRIVDVGHTMDFDLMWDGYDLCNALTRNVIVD